MAKSARKLPIDEENDDEGDLSEKGGIDQSLDLDTASIEENEDGSATITLDDDAPGRTGDEHFANLAKTIDKSKMREMATELLQLLEYDKESRKKRDEQYEDGLRRSGLGNDAPGGATFSGASRVVHPMLPQVCIDFASRAMKELMPPNGPVRDSIPGTMSQKVVDKAKRKIRCMNWQLTTQIEEFRSELEKLLTQVPMAGVQYLKIWYDRRMKRPRVEFVPLDDIWLPYSASNWRTAQRKTHVQHLTEMEFRQRVDNGDYLDVGMLMTTPADQTRSAEASDRIEGKEDDTTNVDNVRDVYEIDVLTDLEDDELRPYLVSIDEPTQEIVGIYRNWDEDDDTYKHLQHIIEFPFVPWRGAHPIGLPHLIGGLAAAATGALRALLDAAFLANSQTAVKLVGGDAGGQELSIEPTEVKEIKGGFEQDDIRKVMMPLPFPGPNAVLLELLGMVTKYGEDLIITTFKDLAQQTTEMPVGTTLALIEQGMMVFSAIHARLHAAMKELLAALHWINSVYLEESDLEKQAGSVLAHRKDFEGPMDVIPVSDPNIFSDVQRQAQIALIAQRAVTVPGIYDLYKVEKRILEHARIPAAEELLVQKPEPQRLHAVNENMAMALARPVIAFPNQDHLAHLDTHVAFAMHPMFGENPIIKPKLVQILLPHITEHLVMQYLTWAYNAANEAADMDVANLVDNKNDDVAQEYDRLMRSASDAALLQAKSNPIFVKAAEWQQMAQQWMQQNMPPPPMDPNVAKVQTEQIKGQNMQQQGQINLQIAQSKLTEQQQKAASSQQQYQADLQESQQRMEIERMKMQADMAADSAKSKIDASKVAVDANLGQQELDQKERIEMAKLQSQHALQDKQNQAALQQDQLKLQGEAQMQQQDLAGQSQLKNQEIQGKSQLASQDHSMERERMGHERQMSKDQMQHETKQSQADRKHEATQSRSQQAHETKQAKLKPKPGTK